MYVALKGTEVVGWGSLSLWSDRCAYSETAETSFYVKASEQGQGIGKLLLKTLDQSAMQLKFHSLVSRITEESAASIHLHKVFGFHQAGVLKEVGLKFGKLLSVCLMQKIYGRSDERQK